mmetsp:Transcript_19512/g.40225  ORF Transcript_19512/g.40225 Transcript_19512/m.40225 type:complete len:275 (-) Transcript_19512:46-870(-)
MRPLDIIFPTAATLLPLIRRTELSSMTMRLPPSSLLPMTSFLAVTLALPCNTRIPFPPSSDPTDSCPSISISAPSWAYTVPSLPSSAPIVMSLPTSSFVPSSMSRWTELRASEEEVLPMINSATLAASEVSSMARYVLGSSIQTMSSFVGTRLPEAFHLFASNQEAPLSPPMVPSKDSCKTDVSALASNRKPIDVFVDVDVDVDDLVVLVVDAAARTHTRKVTLAMLRCRGCCCCRIVVVVVVLVLVLVLVVTFVGVGEAPSRFLMGVGCQLLY